MIDPGLISAGVGLLTSVFGGKPKTPGYLLRSYNDVHNAYKAAMDLYNQTDLEKLDAQTVEGYSKAAWDQAAKMLSNYDAKAAAGGSPIWKGDTAKDRSRTQIAGDTASQVAQLAAQLASTRAQRKASLLPSPSQAGAGMQGAMALDQQALNEQASMQQGLMTAAQLIGQLFNQPHKGSTGMVSGPNDRYVGTGSTAPVGYGVSYGGATPWWKKTFTNTGYTG